MKFVVSSKHITPNVCSPETDIDGISKHIMQSLDKSSVYVPVFLGCGAAIHETNLCRLLIKNGFKLRSGIFLDLFLLSETIDTIATYADEMYPPQHQRPSIVCSYNALISDMIIMQKYDTKFFIVGINCAQSYKNFQELYKFHEFLCLCHNWSSKGIIANDKYVNYLHRECAPKDEGFQNVGTDSNTVYAAIDWWDYACDVITCKGARQLAEKMGTP